MLLFSPYRSTPNTAACAVPLDSVGWLYGNMGVSLSVLVRSGTPLCAFWLFLCDFPGKGRRVGAGCWRGSGAHAGRGCHSLVGKMCSPAPCAGCSRSYHALPYLKQQGDAGRPASPCCFRYGALLFLYCFSFFGGRNVIISLAGAYAALQRLWRAGPQIDRGNVGARTPPFRCGARHFPKK